MNLVDAIRQASQSHPGAEHGEVGGARTQAHELEPEAAPAVQETLAAFPSDPYEADDAPQFAFESTEKPMHDPQSSSQGSIVRLEMFLNAEQLGNLLRAVVATQHTVMTLREAAQHVRMNAHQLEQLAQDGTVPAFLVDGKWRFPRLGLDEWVNAQTRSREAS